MTITTPLGHTYARRAWTGGDKPDIDFGRTPLEKDLIDAYYNEMIAESGGLDLWECAGTTTDERKDMFRNCAIMDAWRTIHP